MLKKATALFMLFIVALGMFLLSGCVDTEGSSSQVQQSSRPEESETTPDSASILPMETDKSVENADGSVLITTGVNTTNYKKIVLHKAAEKSMNSENIFKALIEQQKEPSFLVNDGDMISVKFKNDPPKKVSLYSHYASEDGSFKENETVVSNLNIQDKEVSFLIDEHPIKDFLNGYIHRGYQLVCEWEDEKIEYDFILLGLNVKDVAYS